MDKRYTPERITSLSENEIFVFGSNMEGSHGGGAARLAYKRFGAVWGLGWGLQGQSYAIPTMQGGVETIRPYVDEFIRFAQQNRHLTFLVTRIGCGIAGFRDEEIAPLFKEALNIDNVVLPKEFVDCLKRNQSEEQLEDEITWSSTEFLDEYIPLMQKASKGNSVAYYQVKELRAQEYRNTIEIVNQGFYTTEEGQRVTFPDLTRMEHETAFYQQEFRVDDIPSHKEETKFIVRNVDCLEEGVRLIREGYNPAVLNMASRRNPGGGVMMGAGAQEETLFRRTNLFRSLYQFTEYFINHVWYKKHITPVRTGERYPLNRDFGGVYTPGALLFREDEQHGYKLMAAPERLSFIAVAGINRPDLKDATHLADSMIEGTKNKMRTILRIGLRHGHDSLVLGALGCGAFCNPPSHIAQLFHEVFEEPEFKNKFKLVSFAILDDHNAHKAHNPDGNYKPFVDEFCNKEIEFVIENGCLRDIRNQTNEVFIPEGVKSINLGSFRSNNITKIIHVPSSLKDIGDLQYCSTIEKIIVPSDNLLYTSFDGVVYDKGMEKVIACPSDKTGVHIMPSSCREIESSAFCCSSLNELVINEGLKKICNYAFGDCFIKSWPIIPRSVVSIEGNPFDGEWTSLNIRVYKDSYAHHFAKTHKIRYRCVPEHGETVWSEHEWKESFEKCCSDNGEKGIGELRMNVLFNNHSIYHGQKYMTAHGHCITPNFCSDICSTHKVYENPLQPVSYTPKYETEIRTTPIDAISIARKLKKLDGNVCILGMTVEGTGQNEQLWLRTDYAKWSFPYHPCFIPKVTAFRASEEEGYRLLKHPWHFNLITIPETTEIDKLRNLFTIAIDNSQETVVIDPFVGKPSWSSIRYAEQFKMMLEREFKGCFKRVYFALPERKYDKWVTNMFKQCFTEYRYGETFEIIHTLEGKTGSSCLLHTSRFYGNLKWSLYSDGTLEISGYGRMPDYTNHWDCYFGENQAPWIGCEKYGIMPHKLRICEGITYIGANAFESFGCLKEVLLAESVHELGKMAFFDCFNIKQINKPQAMSIEQFDIAELPLYYNNEYTLKGNLLVSK